MTRDPHLSAAIRAKTLALMSRPPVPPVEKPRGHRQWMTPVSGRGR